jgi:hypothetical protein
VYAADAFSPGKAGEAEFARAVTGVSFALPIAMTGSLDVHYIKAGETTLPAGCTGSVSEPGAAAGNLCVFSENEENVLGVGPVPKGGSESTVGFEVAGLPAAKGNVYITGVWAVTAP